MTCNLIGVLSFTCVVRIHMSSPKKQTIRTRSLQEKTTGHKDSLARVHLARVAIQAAQYVVAAPISEKGKPGWDF